MRTISEAFDLQIVSSSSWGAQRMEELLYQQQTRTVFSAGNGEVELYEFTIPDEWEGHNQCNMITSKQSELVAVTRAGKAMMPDCDLRLKKGDLVLISATLEGSEALRRKLNRTPDQHKA
jgi:trk system potassium uptake protein TrkA